jgi:hypothetical protein
MEETDMEFIKELPLDAAASSNGDHYSFIDSDGNQRNAYQMRFAEPGHETVTCNITGALLERALDNTGELDKSRVIHFFPEAAKLLARHENSQKISFTAHVKAAHYHYSEPTGKITRRYDVEVWDGKNSYQTFSIEDRQDALNKALAWMEKFDNPTLHMTTKSKAEMKRTSIEKTQYEGRKNLSHVEVELHLEYLTHVDGWIVLPLGM